MKKVCSKAVILAIALSFVYLFATKRYLFYQTWETNISRFSDDRFHCPQASDNDRPEVSRGLYDPSRLIVICYKEGGFPDSLALILTCKDGNRFFLPHLKRMWRESFTTGGWVGQLECPHGTLQGGVRLTSLFF
jgi:hypothetical protein